MSVTVGTAAPLFTLPDSDKNMVALSDFKGQKVLLLFFPFAFTGVCTTELCTMRDDIARYNQMQVQVLGISVDSPFTLAAFKKDNQLNFPLLSDFNKTASTAYDALYEEFVLGLKGVSKRSAFVVDELGNIAYAEVLDNAGDLPNFEKINEVLAA